MMKLCLLLLALVLPLAAQNNRANQDEEETEEAEPPENTSDDLNQKRRWDASLPGGAYHVNLGNITSISKHSYVLDGTLLVTEVTIDTTGVSLARFYYLEPITADTKFNVVQRLQERLGEAREKASEYSGTNIEDLAQKNYPNTSHAKTIEFRILSEGELDALYKSLFRAWDTGKGRTFKIR